MQANSRAQASNVETPEGNGTGFVWDKDGHIVTNYHVLANVLRTLPKNQLQRSPRVARITLLGESLHFAMRSRCLPCQVNEILQPAKTNVLEGRLKFIKPRSA